MEKKLAPRQNKARTGELVAAGENGMGAVVLRIIDAQIDPAANNLNSCLLYTSDAADEL